VQHHADITSTCRNQGAMCFSTDQKENQFTSTMLPCPQKEKTHD
jgi:hypothetical protein